MIAEASESSSDFACLCLASMYIPFEIIRETFGEEVLVVYAIHMNIRKFLSVLLSAFLLILLSACQVNENTAGTSREGSLKVCYDPVDTTGTDLHDLLYSFKQATGIENVEVEYLPASGVERETAIKRIRVELMSGAGPDVFLVSCYSEDNALFPYPQKVMGAGVFLPLDTYMENHTEFSEWEKQQPVVLAAGRNDEGQQIIPLTYACPLQVYQKTELDADALEQSVAFEEALSDPKLSSVYTEFYNCRITRSVGLEESKGFAPNYLEYIMGQLADFNTEELLFTEEELFSVIERIFDLEEDHFVDGTKYEETVLSYGLTACAQPFTLIPLYSTKGGITVSVQNFAAINRNTKMPDEAYRFIDFFMREATQANAHAYQAFYAYGEGIPLHTDIFSESSPWNKFHHLSDEAFLELQETKNQITAVNFNSELTKDLAELMAECWEAEVYDQPISLEERVHETYAMMQRRVRE